MEEEDTLLIEDRYSESRARDVLLDLLFFEDLDECFFSCDFTISEVFWFDPLLFFTLSLVIWSVFEGPSSIILMDDKRE